MNIYSQFLTTFAIVWLCYSGISILVLFRNFSKLPPYLQERSTIEIHPSSILVTLASIVWLLTR